MTERSSSRAEEGYEVMFLFFRFSARSGAVSPTGEPDFLARCIVYDQQVGEYGRTTDEAGEVKSEVREPLRGGGSRAALLG